MADLLRSGAVPVTDGVYVNSETQIGLCLRLLGCADRSQIIFVKCADTNLSTRFVLHLAAIVPHVTQRNHILHWHTSYDPADFPAYGQSLQDLFVESLLEPCVGQHLDSGKLLCFDIGVSGSVEKYVDMNLLPLLSRPNGDRFLLVLEMKKVAPEGRGALELVRQLVRKAPSGIVSLIVLGDERPRGISDLNEVVLDPRLGSLIPGHGAAPVVRHHGSGPRRRLVVPGTSNVVHILHPLIALNQSAQETVVDYLRQHPSCAVEVEELISDSLLQRFHDGTIGVTDRGIDLASEYTPPLGIYADVVPNGAKVLSFQPPAVLVRQESSLENLITQVEDNRILLDCFVRLIGGHFSRSDNIAATEVEINRVLKGARAAFSAKNKEHTRRLLAYFSQLLIQPKFEMGVEHFRLMEALTHGFCSFLVSGGAGTAIDHYEAARWVKNLADVFEKVGAHRASLPADNAKIRSLYRDGAEYIRNLSSDDLRLQANARYTAGWHTESAGDPAGAQDIFFAGAAELRRFGRAVGDGGYPLDYHWWEMLFLGLAASPCWELPSAQAEILEEFIAANGILLTLGEINAALWSAPGETSPLPILRHSVRTTACIYFCKWDFYAALMIGSMLLFNFSVRPRFILVGRDEDMQAGLGIPASVHLVLGAPDSPGVGGFINSVAPELERIYQLNCTRQFHYPVELARDGRRIVILAACGLGGIIDAWARYLERAEPFGGDRKLLQELLANTFISTILQGCVGGVTSAFTEGVSQRLWPGSQSKEMQNRLREVVEQLVSINAKLASGVGRDGGEKEETVGEEAAIRMLLESHLGRSDAKSAMTACLRIFDPANMGFAVDGLIGYLDRSRLKMEEISDISRVMAAVCRKISGETRSTSVRNAFQSYAGFFGSTREKADHLADNYRRDPEYPAREIGRMKELLHAQIIECNREIKKLNEKG